MAITTLSSREFNQDASRAKRAAARGPVFITDRGRPSHVFMTVKQYEKIMANGRTIIEMLAMENGPNISFEAPRIAEDIVREVDLG